jgi:hypothetical protein
MGAETCVADPLRPFVRLQLRTTEPAHSDQQLVLQDPCEIVVQIEIVVQMGRVHDAPRRAKGVPERWSAAAAATRRGAMPLTFTRRA